MKLGDCINIPTEVKHWHGAAPDERFSHLAMKMQAKIVPMNALEPVSVKNIEN